MLLPRYGRSTVARELTHPYQNQLLQLLSAADLSLLEPHFQSEEIPERREFEKPNRPVGEVHFLERGLASMVARSTGAEVEVGIVGRDGVTGHVILLGSDRSQNAMLMQVSGGGFSIPSRPFRDALAKARRSVRCSCATRKPSQYNVRSRRSRTRAAISKSA